MGGPSPDQVVLLVQFLVSAKSSHTKDFKNGSGPCLHGTYDEVGTVKHNWLAWCQYNVTGWVSMLACDIYVIPVRQHYKAGIESHCYKCFRRENDPSCRYGVKHPTLTHSLTVSNLPSHPNLKFSL